MSNVVVDTQNQHTNINNSNAERVDEQNNLDNLIMQDQGENQTTDFLETSVINDIKKNIENLEVQVKDKKGDEEIEIRIKQLSYAKLLVNVYEKEITYLIFGHTSLGITYLNNGYFEQAQEHLLNAFKLNERLGEEEGTATSNTGTSMKEFQIKILTNLARTYLELKNVTHALNISERCLKMNQTLFGEEDVSNAEIYQILARGNAQINNFKVAEGFFSKMFDLYEKTYGFDSEKCAQTCMDLAQIYELNENFSDAIEYFKFAYEIWDKVIKSNYSPEVLDKIFSVSERHSFLQHKSGNNEEAYNFLKKCEVNFFKHLENKLKKKADIKRSLIKYAEAAKNVEAQFNELSDYEVIFYIIRL